jgi:two-component system NtrC family sensor kinase
MSRRPAARPRRAQGPEESPAVKLGFRFTLFLVVPLVALTVLLGFWYLQESRRTLREELRREGRAIALVVQVAAEDYLRDRQFEDLRRFVDQVTGYERLLGLRLFDAAGAIAYQSAVLDTFPFRHRSVLSEVLRTGQPGETQRRFGHQPVLGYIYPLRAADGALVGAVQVLQLESFMEEDERGIRRFILALTIAMVLAIVLVVYLVTRHNVARPIDELVRSFREVGARERPTPVPVRREDEFGRLAREFNGMCERLEAARRSLIAEQEERRRMEEALRNAERLAGLGRLAAGLAHEINTPLNVIGGRAEALRRTVEGQEAAERNLRIITAQIERIARTVRDMLDFARMKPARRVATDLNAAVVSVLDLMENQLEHRGVRVRLEEAAEVPPITADPDQLQQVFLNVVINAMDAMEGGGSLRVRTFVADAAHPERPGGAVRCAGVEFEDTGAGIPPEDHAHVFDPFFTTKGVGHGTGLGLSVSYGIVRDHGGWFDLDSAPGRGTRIAIHLPIEPAPERAAGGEAA